MQDDFVISDQADAALACALACQAIEDMWLLDMLLEAGCTLQEARALIHQEVS
jgi:hypothetical protein